MKRALFRYLPLLLLALLLGGRVAPRAGVLARRCRR